MQFVPHCRPFNDEEDEHYLQVFDLIAHVPYYRDPEPGRSLEDGLALVVKTFCPSAFEATGVYLWEGGTGAKSSKSSASSTSSGGGCCESGEPEHTATGRDHGLSAAQMRCWLRYNRPLLSG